MTRKLKIPVVNILRTSSQIKQISPISDIRRKTCLNLLVTALPAVENDEAVLLNLHQYTRRIPVKND